MTERDRLAAAARSAGLRLTERDLDALLGPYRRYQSLMAALEESLADENPAG